MLHDIMKVSHIRPLFHPTIICLFILDLITDKTFMKVNYNL